jgi:hypothetical protein
VQSVVRDCIYMLGSTLMTTLIVAIPLQCRCRVFSANLYIGLELTWLNTMSILQVPYGLLQPRTVGLGAPQGGCMGAGSPQGLHAPAATRPPPLVMGMTLGTASPSMEGGPSGPLPVMSMSPGTGLTTMSAGSMDRGEPLKRKRGRPRKYTSTDTEGNVIPLSLPLSASPAAGTPSSLSERRGRGRPLGSGKKQQLAALGMYLALVG